VLTSLYRSSDDPFALTPEYRACFKHRSFVAAKRRLVESLQATGGITTITGAPGTGKTTLINDVVSRLSPTQVTLGRVVTTQLRAPDLLRAVAFSFGLDGKRPQSAVLLKSLQHYWAKQLRMRRRIILVVDEAQALQACAGRLLGRLASYSGAEPRWLHLILAGDATADATTRPSPFERLAALATVRCHLQPLSVGEIEGYVRHRLDNRGWCEEPYITQQALKLVYHQTGGVPAGINLLCRRLLLCGSVERKRRLHTDEVHRVLGELEAESLLPTPAGARP
jgi:type II secretory pathway predicted ATPase ExeA